MVPHWTVPNAIALGNAVIVKPSELTPISAAKMAEMWKEAGLPDGILNIVNGGKDVVEAICDHKDIKAVSFVGSTPVADIVYKRASASSKRVLALGGAKNHMIVMPDATEDATVRDLIASGFGMSGQRCMAASVIIEVGDIQNIIDKLVAEAKVMKPGVDLPPLINPAAIDKITKYLDKSKAEGATVLVDGRENVDASAAGYNFGPSIIDFRNGGTMGDEEIFGPTLEIVHANSLEEALEIQNRSPYGNAGAIFTQNGRYAAEALAGLQAGMLGVNIGVPVPREPFSFGGIKDSKFGVGDITGVSSIDFWTYERKTTTKWNVEKKADWMS
jgi:malonate-semialdehyde dehydrogenase (acetylating)/methylmalonate-semialdehyde dehydrogenase